MNLSNRLKMDLKARSLKAEAPAEILCEGGEGMAWISVYQEVDGPKLRRLARLLETSKAESLGILNFLWFWGMNNADETGKVFVSANDKMKENAEEKM